MTYILAHKAAYLSFLSPLTEPNKNLQQLIPKGWVVFPPEKLC